MSNFKQITLVGRVTRTPDVKYLESGKAVGKLSVAVNRWVPKDADPITDFFDCVVWEKQAEFVGQYIDKGRLVLIVGDPQIRDWTDKDGAKRKSFEVRVQEIKTLERAPDKAEGQESGDGEAVEHKPAAKAAATPKPKAKQVNWDDEDD